MNDRPKGICRMGVVPMRATSKQDGLMVSQLLFGEHYTVLKEKEQMVLIELHYDQSTGWIRSDQHSPISEEYFQQVNLSDYKVCIDLSGTIFFQKKHVHILFGSILPISTNELFKLEEQVAFNGESKSLAQKREFGFMEEMIKKFIHAPFLPGGKTPFGVDEGGFIQQVFKVCGYKLPRTVKEQSESGHEVPNIDDITPGDLIFSGDQGYVFLGGDEYAGIYKGQVCKVGNDQLGNKLTARRLLHKNLIADQH